MEYLTSAAETGSFLKFFAVYSLHVTSSSFVQSSSGIVECCFPRFKFGVNIIAWLFIDCTDSSSAAGGKLELVTGI